MSDERTDEKTYYHGYRIARMSMKGYGNYILSGEKEIHKEQGIMVPKDHGRSDIKLKLRCKSIGSPSIPVTV